ncbi:SAG family member [Eimeria mitis]|uniref:SAG family member n=1 Tax=Eimeria mitis TaxID=44415 RepID=U6JZ82_9EIME|nr:SAG family member [Eimeria mitis]CDJ30051.1 SAG family member [Eimeria mitis]
MAPLKIVSLACASALLIAQANTKESKGQEEDLQPGESPTYTVTVGKTGVCLDEMNAARGAAGLAHFLAAAEGSNNKWPQTEQDVEESNPWHPVCEALIAEGEPATEDQSTPSNTFPSGTYAFMALDTAEADCVAAVSHWKDAVSNFTSLPPSKTKGTTLYEKQQNVSFVALYNPSDSASVDCRVITCTQKLAQGPAALSIRSSVDGKKGHALLCMTTLQTVLVLTAESSPALRN